MIIQESNVTGNHTMSERDSEAKSMSGASANTVDQPLRDIWYDLLREWCERTRYMTLGDKHDIAWTRAVEYLATVEPRGDGDDAI